MVAKRPELGQYGGMREHAGTPAAAWQATACQPTARERPADGRLPAWGLLDNVRSAWNVGSMFRTADAAGMAGLYLGGFTPTPPRPDIEKTALGATGTVPWDYWPDAAACARAVRAGGVSLVVLEQAPGAVHWETATLPFPHCFVVGHEVRGVSPELLALADLVVEIPMYGAKRSLNVAVSFGLLAYQARRQWQGLHDRSGGA
ncbi:MAG: TrmH family RNA methyltransferase [bacterium]|nr:TrmH family RNA methyltransferase [bacterium]